LGNLDAERATRIVIGRIIATAFTWPQFRVGMALRSVSRCTRGFLKLVDDRTLAFADYRGNRHNPQHGQPRCLKASQNVNFTSCRARNKDALKLEALVQDQQLDMQSHQPRHLVVIST
jgi:hypothetical protein